ncbi:MAG: hypothetical protein ABW200_10755, partial [Hyphomicrobiaceae bacterium]
SLRPAAAVGCRLSAHRKHGRQQAGGRNASADVSRNPHSETPKIAGSERRTRCSIGYLSEFLRKW